MSSIDNLSPIVIFAYNRAWHLRQTVECLQKNELASESELFVYGDGPKNEYDQEKVKEVREYIGKIKGFKRIEIIKRDKNFGLANSIIEGVTEIVNRYGKIIVLEDDLVTSPYFLKFMNEALVMYENEEKVVSIHGYTYPVKVNLLPTFFIRGADCWGWATWERSWDVFEPDGEKLLKELKTNKLTKEFDFNGAYNYSKMLQDQIKGKNDSWAIRWYASAFLKGMLTLYPFPSLVNNIGLDASGRHSGTNSELLTELSQYPIPITKIPLEENIEACKAFEQFLCSIRPIKRIKSIPGLMRFVFKRLLRK